MLLILFGVPFKFSILWPYLNELIQWWSVHFFSRFVSGLLLLLPLVGCRYHYLIIAECNRLVLPSKLKIAATHIVLVYGCESLHMQSRWQSAEEKKCKHVYIDTYSFRFKLCLCASFSIVIMRITLNAYIKSGLSALNILWCACISWLCADCGDVQLCLIKSSMCLPFYFLEMSTLVGNWNELEISAQNWRKKKTMVRLFTDRYVIYIFLDFIQPNCNGHLSSMSTFYG